MDSNMIKKIINEIDKCLEQDLYLAALTMALTLPDACAKVEYPEIKQNKRRYLKWTYEKMDKYDIPKQRNDEEGVPKFVHFDGFLLYDLRCRLLHEGNPQFKHELVTDTKLYYEKGGSSGQFSLSYDNSTPPNIRRSAIVNIYDVIRRICMCAEVSYERHVERFDKNDVEIYLFNPGISLNSPIHE